MYKENKQVHTVDFLFTMALFCMFAVTALFILFIGADIYQTTASNLGEHSEAVTTMTYISEKVRQQDESHAVSLETLEDIPAIAIHSRVNDTDYVTYIYEYKGELKELYCRQDMRIAPSGGETICEISDFSIIQEKENLYRVLLTDKANQCHSLLLSIRTQ